MRRLGPLAPVAALAVALTAGCTQHGDRTRSMSSIVYTSDLSTEGQLAHGFYEVEQNSWRWTASKFGVTLRRPSGGAVNGARLVADVSVPETVIQAVGNPTLTVALRGERLASTTFHSAGEHRLTVDIAPTSLSEEAVLVEFSLDRYLTAGTVENRELGLIVSSVGLEPK